MADRIELKAEPRSVLGKQVRALRRQGIVPANLYGHADSTALQLPEKEMEHALARAGRTQLLQLALDGDAPTTVLIKDFQRHPTRKSLLHVDFYRVAMTERLKIDVPIRFVGEAPAVKQFDASVFQALSTLSAESLPGDLPEAIEVDVSVLEDLEAAIHVRDLVVPSGVTILTDPDELVVKLLPPMVEEEPEAPEEAETTAEGEATTEASTGDSDAG
ncbi:MAG: 50S ribosomal protein L25 [Chloroflexi bacterium]|nr:50S ribosomal protein L25 [Chloroflexota bacterium]